MSTHVRRTWQVENTWNCQHCGAQNLGRHLACQECGARKGTATRDHVAGPEAPEVRDPQLLKKATAGANWKCEHCGNQERNTEGECTHCAAPKSRPARLMSVPFYTSIEPLLPRSDAASVSSSFSVEKNYDIRPDPLWRRELIGPLRGWHLALIVAGLAGLIWGIVWILTPREVDAKVTDLSWTYTSNIRERQTLADAEWGRPGSKGFYKEPAFNVRCESRYYGTENCNPHQCNAHQVSYSCNCTSYSCNCRQSCTDNRNVFSTCTEVCSTCQRCDTCYRTEYDTCYDQCPVYRDWCSYNYYDWPIKTTQHTSGADHVVRWPDLVPIGDQQRLQKIEKYKVDFRTAAEAFEYAPESLTDFRRFTRGDPWRLKIGKVRGRVENLEPILAEKP